REGPGVRVVRLFADAVLVAPFFLLLEIPALYLRADTAHVVNHQGRGRFGGLRRRRGGGRLWLRRRGRRRRLTGDGPPFGDQQVGVVARQLQHVAFARP